MALSIIFILMILLVQFTFYIRKALNFLQNSIIFMVTAIITRQCVTILGMELEFYKLTEDDWLFVGLLICRDILTPLIAVILVNFNLRLHGWAFKAAAFLGSLAVLLVIDYLLVHFEIITYKQWNFAYAGLLNAALLLAALGLMKLILYIQKWENQHNESI